MCGIAGQLSLQPLDASRAALTLQRMGRRGPDHQCHRNFVEPSGRSIDLFHSRLSIIDMDPRSNQPFQIGRKWIVFNGELYNYREIRDDLTKRGFSPRTTSDTEILLAAIQEFGWEVLDRLEGMWAFAVYDEEDGSVTLCRDRFGEKPLYFSEDDGRFCFGSEIKLIESLTGKTPSIDQQHVIRFLVNGYKSIYKEAGKTFFENISELPSASYLRIEADGRRKLHRYWQPQVSIDDSMSYDEAVKGARERLIRSVELRLRADVPIAFCMSGGVDSNSLISIAKRVFNYDVHGFTIVNQDERYEEQDIIEASVKELGIRHTNIPVDTRDFLTKLRTLVAYHDAPVYTITYFAHWLLMEAVAEHGYRISVSGSAADELFTGYFDHHLFYLAEIHSQSERFERAKRGWEQVVKPIVRNPFLQDPERMVKTPDFRDHMYLNCDEFGSWLKSPWSEAFHEQKFTDMPLRNRMMNELFHEATPVILHEDDMNAMYYSIENRSPFLDRDLFDFCYSIPTHHLMRDGFAKVVLRDAMRGIVPDVVIDNPRKVGFNAPIFSFLDVEHPDVRAQILDNSEIYDIIDRSRIESMMNEETLPNSMSKFLFYFISTKMFLEDFASRSGGSSSQDDAVESTASTRGVA